MTVRLQSIVLAVKILRCRRRVSTVKVRVGTRLPFPILLIEMFVRIICKRRPTVVSLVMYRRGNVRTLVFLVDKMHPLVYLLPSYPLVAVTPLPEIGEEEVFLFPPFPPLVDPFPGNEQQLVQSLLFVALGPWSMDKKKFLFPAPRGKKRHMEVDLLYSRPFATPYLL